MLKRIACFTFLSGMLVTPALAVDQDIVVDNFESYADTAALLAAWPSSDPLRPDNATRLIPGDTIGDDDGAFYGGTNLTKFAQFCGSANDATGIGNCDLAGSSGVAGGGTVNLRDLPMQIAPSATQNVVLSVDIGDDAFSSNKRLSVGLRSAAPAENIIELGFFNNPAHFSYRGVLFPGTSIFPATGGWGQFGDTTIEDPLDPALDSPLEVGRGFHRYKAVISTTGVTFTLDLYADSKTNDPLDPVPGVGPDGVDAMDVTGLITGPNGFDQIRFGIPSANPSSGGTVIAAAFAAFDNISLRLVDIGGAAPGDFDGDGDADGRDFLAWQRGESPMPYTAADLAEWQDAYTPGPLSALAVPEPTSAGLMLLALSSLLAIKRR